MWEQCFITGSHARVLWNNSMPFSSVATYLRNGLKEQMRIMKPAQTRSDKTIT